MRCLLSALGRSAGQGGVRSYRRRWGLRAAGRHAHVVTSGHHMSMSAGSSQTPPTSITASASLTCGPTQRTARRTHSGSSRAGATAARV